MVSTTSDDSIREILSESVKYCKTLSYKKISKWFNLNILFIENIYKKKKKKKKKKKRNIIKQHFVATTIRIRE